MKIIDQKLITLYSKNSSLYPQDPLKILYN